MDTSHIDNLNASDEATRLDAIRVLGEQRDAQVVDVLLPLLDDESPAIRRETILALRRLNDERAFPAMIRTLADTDNSVRRRTSAWIMSMGHEPRLVAPLIDVLTDVNSRLPAREFAAMALGNIGDPTAVEALADVLLTAPDELKRRITHSLSMMPDPRAIPALSHMLTNEDIPTRKIAAKTLRKIGTPEAIAALESMGDAES
ncbi:MAG: HEAT repeat domain-containing protein [Aggregatilineales bacterium]